MVKFEVIGNMVIIFLICLLIGGGMITVAYSMMTDRDGNLTELGQTIVSGGVGIILLGVILVILPIIFSSRGSG